MTTSSRLLTRAAVRGPDLLRDQARSFLDVSLPSRRAANAERRRASALDIPVARMVSPKSLVLSGPFAGMRMPEPSVWTATSTYLTGQYEREIHPFIENAIGAVPSLVVDVGSAEGYYAVGFAKRLPATTVLAYDIDPIARRATRRLASANRVHNLRTHGRISPPHLQAVLEPGSLVLSDCEGYERELLDLAAAPALRTSSILVEMHDYIVAGTERLLLDRFADTHTVAVARAIDRSPVDAPHLSHLPAILVARVLQEGRPGAMTWAYFRPRM